jgi:hypothetical protein
MSVGMQSGGSTITGTLFFFMAFLSLLRKSRSNKFLKTEGYQVNE